MAGSDHRDRDEDEDEERGEGLGRDIDGLVAGEPRYGAQRRDRQTDEQKRLDESEQQLLAGAVIGESIPLEARLAQHEAADPDLAPKPVHAEGRNRQQDVHDVDAEERSARAVEAEPTGSA